MSCTGGDAGGVGGGRKLGNHPLPPLGRMAGTKRERPRQRLQGGGEGVHREHPGGTLGEGVSESLHRAHPRDTHLPVPAPSLTGATFFHAAQNTESRRIGSSPTPGPLSPGIPAENQLRDGGAGRVDGSPSPLPTHSQSPPTASRRFPGHRSARFWRPESRRGDPGAPRGCRGSKGTPRTAGGRDRGFRAHLAGQLSAPVDPRPCEGFDPRHNPMEGRPGGCGADPGVRLLWGEGGEGSAPHASVWGTGSLTPLAQHPAPVPQTRVSTPARAQEGGRRGGGRAECRAPDGTPRSVEGRLARVHGVVDWQSSAGVCLCVCVCVCVGVRGEAGMSLTPAASAAVFLKPSLAGPVALTPRSSSPSPSPSPKQSISLERPAGRRIPAVPSSPGNPDQFLPGLWGPIKAGQSQPTPTFTIGAGVGRGRRNQRGTKGWVLVLYRAWRKNPRGESPSPSPKPLWGLPGRHSAPPLPSCFCLHRRLGARGCGTKTLRKSFLVSNPSSLCCQLDQNQKAQQPTCPTGEWPMSPRGGAVEWDTLSGNSAPA